MFRRGWETLIRHTSIISRPLILSPRSQDMDRTSLGDSQCLATNPQHTQSWVSKALKTDRRPFLLTSVLLFLYFHIFHLPHQLLLSLTKVQQQYNLVRNVDEVSVFQIHNITFDFPLELPHLVVILKGWWKTLNYNVGTSYTLVTTDMPTNLWYVNEYWIRHRCYYFFWLLGLVCPIWRHAATT